MVPAGRREAGGVIHLSGLEEHPEQMWLRGSSAQALASRISVSDGEKHHHHPRTMPQSPRGLLHTGALQIHELK